jgi:hypothetical protein
MRTKACARLRVGPESGTWYRAIEPQYLLSALGTAHTRNNPTRFSSGLDAVVPFEILYLTESHMVALWEVGAMLGNPLQAGRTVARPRGSWTIIDIAVRLQRVADLTKVSQQRLLGTTAQELTGDWEGYQQRSAHMPVSEPIGPAPTQDLGDALFALPGLEGFRTLSARLPYHLNLVVFPEKLQPGSRLEFRHPETGRSHIIEPPAPRQPS